MKQLAIVISVFILKSCGGSQDMANATNNSSKMSGKETISGVYSVQQLETITVTDKELTFDFNLEENRVSGFSGCNHFSGTLTVDGSSMSMSQIRTTMMMCEGEANTIEQKVFEILAKVNAYEMTDDTLKLKHNTEVLLVALKTLTSEFRQSNTTIDLTYRASTRGFFESIWIKDNVVKFTNDRDLKDISKFTLTEGQYSELLELYKVLDLTTLSSLEPPSKTFQYDAAAFATLEVKEGENTFKTKGFDHGNPPKSIALIVEKILSIKEAMSKH